VRLSAAASSSLRSALTGPPRPATWLGATTAALYWQIAGEPGVLALLANDAVRLPCALVLPTSAAELPLTSLARYPAAPAGECLIGDGALTWCGAAGPVVVRAVREWRPASVRPMAVRAGALAAVFAAVPAPLVVGVDGASVAMLGTDPAAAVVRLLGRGPGLTPAGDDVLAGFLIGARAFGLEVGVMRARLATLAPARTTALSAALLWHAARGDCVDELAAVTAQLAGEGSPGTVGRLLAVGHTSGAALAIGLVAAAAVALRASTRRTA
jgi:Protein of unknown function (DUF2877)